MNPPETGRTPTSRPLTDRGESEDALTDPSRADTPAPDPLEPLVARIRQASREIVRELGLGGASPRGAGCSTSQCHALIELQRRGPLSVGELARMLRQDRSTASRGVQPLVARGLVRVDGDPADRRSKILSLTGKGRREVRGLHARADAQVREALAVLGEEERETAAAGMQAYAKGLGRARQLAEVRIRPVRASDDRPLSRIIRQVMREHGADGVGSSIHDGEIDGMYEAYTRPRAAFFVAERDGRLLGGAGIGPLQGADPDICELRKMYLLPEGRGMGLGRRLLDRCLDAARSAGFTTCYLETMETMSQARRLYAKLGFAARDRPLGDTGHFGCDRWMAREL